MRESGFRRGLLHGWAKITVPLFAMLALALSLLGYQQLLRSRLQVMMREEEIGRYYIMNQIDKNAARLEQCAPALCGFLSAGKSERIQIYTAQLQLIGDSAQAPIRLTGDIQAAAEGKKGYQYFFKGPLLYLSISSPVFDGATPVAVLRSVQEQGVFLLGGFTMGGFLLCGVAACIWYALASLSAEHAARPLESLHQVVMSASPGESLTLQTEEMPKELQELAVAYSHIYEENRRHIEGIKQEREKQSLFFGEATHQLKTPLTSIIGYSQIISRLCGDAQLLECADYIQQAGNHLLKIVESMLEISRYRHSEYEFAPQWFLIADLVEECTNLMLPRLRQSGILLENRCGVEEIYFDRHSLREVILNILDNGIRHSKGTRITVTTDTLPVRLVLQDNGAGMDASKLQQIFDPFFRTKGSVANGSGLGLAICKEMMMGQGGDIVAESIPGKGTRFTLYFQDKDESPQLVGNMARRI